MRHAMLCLLLMLCSVFTFSQEQPQWKVVQSVVLRGQTAPIPQTTLFTPQEPGLYRFSGYVSGTAHNRAGLAFGLTCTDETGFQGCGVSMGAGYLQPWESIGAYVFSPRPGTPVYYFTEFDNPPPQSPKYTLVFTIEQLQ